MLAQPPVPSVTLAPQYSQVMIISPNLGAIGAPQLGHFSDVAVDGARTWAVGAEAEDCWDEFPWPDPTVRVPHLEQKAASSGSCEPHLKQYISTQFSCELGPS